MASLETRLRTAGNRRRRAEKDRLAAARALHYVVREAAGTAGWTKTRIAEVAGITRQTVHEILKDTK